MATDHGIAEVARPTSKSERDDRRCLVEIVVHDFGGNLMAFCRKHGLSPTFRSNLSALLCRDRSAEMSRAIIEKVACALRRRAEVLFPDATLLHRLCIKLKETEGYQAIVAKHAIHFHGADRSTLASLMRDKGFRKTDTDRLRNLLMRNFALPSNKKFCLRVSEALSIPVEELFPPAIYGTLDRELA